MNEPGTGAPDEPAGLLQDVPVPTPDGRFSAHTDTAPPAESSVDPATQQRPASLRALFIAFTALALQGFGGVLPVAQRELVERHGWLTREQFVEMLAVSQVLPGPNVVNLALMFGDRQFGLRGALTALAGMLLVPLAVVLALTALYGHFASLAPVRGALRGVGAVAAGLILSTGLKLLAALRHSALGLRTGLALAALMALASAGLHWPLIWLLAGLGTISCSVAWHRLGP